MQYPQLRVVATDGGGSAVTATALITVDRNLNNPIFLTNKTVDVTENYPLASSIIDITAVDNDILVR